MPFFHTQMECGIIFEDDNVEVIGETEHTVIQLNRFVQACLFVSAI